jgi:predicted aconitase
VAEEFFSVEGVPVICVVGEDGFEELLRDGDDSLTVRMTVDDNGQCGEDVIIENQWGKYAGKNLLHLKDTLEDSTSLPIADTESQAQELALKTIRRVASITSSKKLIPITSAHIDAVTYIGPGGLAFVQKLVQLGGRVCVPTTLNAQSVDRRRWQALGVDAEYASNANAVGDAYLGMGCDDMSFTCAPYLLEKVPRLGEQIMWGESNAVVYSNSVIGARTEKYADYFDILAAICGAGEFTHNFVKR